MFGKCGLHGCAKLSASAQKGESVELENFFSRLALDIIGKAVFNNEFDSLTHDDPVIKAVYTALREAEFRSLAIVPFWNIPGIRYIVPSQQAVHEALEIINATLDGLIAKCKRMVEEEDQEFVEEYLNVNDPSILHFLIASGDEVSSKQLRDDLMTMLIAGHETNAAVLTWTFYLLAKHPDIAERCRAEARHSPLPCAYFGSACVFVLFWLPHSGLVRLGTHLHGGILIIFGPPSHRWTPCWATGRRRWRT